MFLLVSVFRIECHCLFMKHNHYTKPQVLSMNYCISYQKNHKLNLNREHAPFHLEEEQSCQCCCSFSVLPLDVTKHQLL